jgi:hypothetical protein
LTPEQTLSFLVKFFDVLQKELVLLGSRILRFVR